MPLIQPDPTFYPSAREAMLVPREELAYVALLDTAGEGRPDGLATIDLSDGSISLDLGFFVDFAADGRRAHQILLQGGVSSSDSYCFL
ncbi:hypothetical protein [Streptosporangium sp. NPDC087985]|uniref:hypothetical protein n=1 Tax=Streptosporangium sp. NPDC087985 TaxID=3366196 RepID=UPI00380AADD5